ncbi:hypothetical protein [Spiroplasma endosymbiont of Labia minor]|uniref:hypothetical protein n=1 Tax=Spiroplasma endosymbiont of Labia minor TaxID=3066305 RepID=UPI0030CB1BCC
MDYGTKIKDDLFDDSNIILEQAKNLSEEKETELTKDEEISIKRDVKILELEEEIVHLKAELKLFEGQKNYLSEGVQKTKEAFEVARHNAEKIVMKAVDFSFLMRNKIVTLLKEIENAKTKNQTILTLIEDFIQKNSKIFRFTDDEQAKVAELITNQIVKAIK